MDTFLKEVQDTFLLESQDLLLNVENLFLILEKNPNDVDVFNQLSRLAHNLKGSGRAVGFSHIADFSHELESLMLACKSQTIESSPAVIDLLFRCVDAMKSDIEAMRSGGAIKDYSILLLEIEQILTAEGSFFRGEEASTALQTSFVGGGKSNKIQAIEYLRIPTFRIEALIDTFGEQVILQSILDQSKIDIVKNEDRMLKTIGQLSKLTNELQLTALSLRMVSLKLLFSKLERAVRDAAKPLGKPISFTAKGSDKELDKAIVDALSDTLTHMVRNSVDHGIESVEERLACGKRAEGLIEINATRTGGSMVIEVKDDGRGLNPVEIFEKAKRLQIISPGAELSEKKIFDLIFENGFSMKDSLSDISGRGVGLNVVKEKILELKGRCEIDSQLGKGTTFRIQLPLTLAIFNAMIVKVGNEKFAIPTSDVDEVSRIDFARIQFTESSQQFIEIRDQVYKFVDMRRELFKEAVVGRNAQVTALLVRRTNHPFAILVDEVLSIQKIVHKPVDQNVRQVKGSAGATILGDGSVSLILNITQFAPKTAESIHMREVG